MLIDSKPLFLCEPYVNSQLVRGSIQTIVILPKYVDVSEWLALNGTIPLLWTRTLTNDVRV
jgi:hypothetical protein